MKILKKIGEFLLIWIVIFCALVTVSYLLGLYR